MKCPNVKTGIYQTTARKYGDDVVLPAMERNNGHGFHLAPNGKESKLYHDIERLTESTEKADIYKMLMFNNSAEKIYGQWWNGKTRLKLDENGEPFVEDVLPYLVEKYEIENARAQVGNVKEKGQQLLNELKKRVDVPFVEDYELKEAAVWDIRNKEIRYNPDHLTLATGFHEVGHVLAPMIKLENMDLWKAMVASVPEDVKKMVNTLYYEKYKGSEAMLEEEAVVRHLESVTQDIYLNRKKLTLESIAYRLYEWISDLLYKVRGIRLQPLTLAKSPFVGIANKLLYSKNITQGRPVGSQEMMILSMGIREKWFTRDGKVLYDDIRQLQSDIKNFYPGANLVFEVREDAVYMVAPEYPQWMYSLKFTDEEENKFNAGKYTKSINNPDKYTGNGEELEAVGSFIRNSTSNESLKGLTDAEVKQKRAEMRAEKHWGNTPRNVPKLIKPRLSLTFERAIEYYKKQTVENTSVGKALHAIAELLVYSLAVPDKAARDTAYMQELRDKSERFAKEGGKDKNFASNLFLRMFSKNGITNDKLLEKKLRLSGVDNLRSEVTLSSTELGLGGTADLFSHNNDGSYTLKDFKFGNLSDDGVTVFEGTNYAMTAQNQAEVQLATYALITKLADKGAKFKNTGIIHVNPNNEVIHIPVNWPRALEIIKVGLKKAGKEDFVNSNPKLFDAREYIFSAVDELGEEFVNMPREEAIKQLRNRVLTGMPNAQTIDNVGKYFDTNPTVREHFEQLLQVMAGLDNVNTVNLDDKNDMSKAVLWGGWMQLADNPNLQALNNIWSEAHTNYHSELFSIIRKHDELLGAVIEEAGGTNLYNRAGRLIATDIERYVGFMWVRDEQRDALRLIDNSDAEFDLQVNTDAKKAYHAYYKKQMLEAANEHQGILSTNKAVSEMPYYVDDFMNEKLPTIYIKPTKNDIKDIVSFKAQMRALLPKDASLGSIMEYLFGKHADVSQKDIDYRIPIRNTSVKDDHTLDTEYMFMSHISNMKWKKYMDPTIEIFNATASALPKNEVGESLTPNNKAFLNNFVETAILGQKKYMTKGIPVKVEIQNTDGSKRTISKRYHVGSALLDGLRAFNTYTIMPLRAILGFRNAIMEDSFNITEGVKGSATSFMVNNEKIAKFLNIQDTARGDAEVLYTAKHVAKAHAIMAQAGWDHATKEKIKNLSTKFKLTVDFTYEFNRDKKRKLDQSLLKTSNLFVTSSVGEDFAANISWISSMVRDGMWDKYDQDGNYIGEVRFKKRTHRGYEDVNGYDHKEIERIRETMTRVHGSYMKERAVYLEAYALGRVLLQFKKYMINYGVRSLKGRYNSQALGQFVKTGEIVDGVDVFEWEAQEIEGSFRLLPRILAIAGRSGLNLFRNEKLQQELSLTKSDIAGFLDLVVVGALNASLALMMMMLFDDDDEDKNERNLLYSELVKLRRDVGGIYNPLEWSNNMRSPSIAITRTLDLIDAIYKIGDKYKTTSKIYGYTRGEDKGLRRLRMSISPSALREYYTIQGIFDPESVPERYRPEEIIFSLGFDDEKKK